MDKSVLKELHFQARNIIPQDVLDILYDAQNPEAMLRKSLAKFCVEEKVDDAIDLMNDVVSTKHEQALYCLNFIKLFSSNTTYVEEGAHGLSLINQRPKGSALMAEYRRDLATRLLQFFVFKNPLLLDIPMICNVDDDNFVFHIRENMEPGQDCPRCLADTEVFDVETDIEFLKTGKSMCYVNFF